MDGFPVISRLAILLSALICAAPTAMTQERPGKWHIEQPASLQRAEIEDVRIIFNLERPWHLYAPTAANSALGVVGLAVNLELPEGLTISKPQFPKSVNKGLHDVFEGPRVAVRLRLRAAPDAAVGAHTMNGAVQYQFCQPSFCLPPYRDEISVTVNIE